MNKQEKKVSSTFKFCTMSIKDEDFLNIIKEHWIPTTVLGTPMYQAVAKLERLKKYLRVLHMNGFGEVHQKA